MSLSYRKLSTLTLLFFLPCCLSAQSLPKINVEFNQTKLADAFAELEAQYAISFSFEDEIIEGKFVTIKIRRLPLDRAMEKLLAGTGLGFDIVDSQYVLIKRGNAPPKETAPTPPQLTVCGQIFDA